VRQLLAYGTGSAVRFGDRGRVEEILDRTAADGWGVRSVLVEIALSGLFQCK
jgi:hypothetical protein